MHFVTIFVKKHADKVLAFDTHTHMEIPYEYAHTGCPIRTWDKNMHIRQSMDLCGQVVYMMAVYWHILSIGQLLSGATKQSVESICTMVHEAIQPTQY